MGPTAAPGDVTSECFSASPTIPAIRLHAPNLSAVLLWKTHFTIFEGNCDAAQFSVLPEGRVELGDVEKYLYYSHGLQLHPKQQSGIAVPCDTVLGNFPLGEPSCVQSRCKINNMQRCVLHSFVEKCIIYLLIYCLMLVLIFFHLFDTLLPSHPVLFLD